MVRGLLRKDLGFEGIISCDSIAMEAIVKYAAKNLPSLPSKFQNGDVSQFNGPEGTLIFIMSVYAGINHVVGYWENGPVPDDHDVKKFYNANKEFKVLFDDLALETLFLKIKLMPDEIRPPGLPDLSGVSLRDLKAAPGQLPAEKREKIDAVKKLLEGSGAFMKKFDVLVTNGLNWRPSLEYRRGSPTSSRSDPSVEKVLTYYAEYSDLLNRGGLFDVGLRTSILKHLSGTGPSEQENEFSNSWAGNISSNPVDWRFDEPDAKKGSVKEIDALFSNPDFKKAYESMDWNSKEWQSVFAEYSRRQNEGELENMGIKRLVPKSDWFQPAEPQLILQKNKK